MSVRLLEPSDLPVLTQLANDPEVRQLAVGWDWPVSAHGQPAWLESTRSAPHTHRLAVVNRESARPLASQGCGTSTGTPLSHVRHQTGCLQVSPRCRILTSSCSSTPGRSTRSVCTGCGRNPRLQCLPATTRTSGNGGRLEGIETPVSATSGRLVGSLPRCVLLFRLLMHIRRGQNTEHHLPRGHDTI